jgi:acyl-CoA thioesterase FadM
MSRVNLNLPRRFSYQTEFRVRISDINYGGHLGNDRLLALIHEARIRHLSSFGHTETDVGGAGMIQTDAVIIYRAEAFHHDNLLVRIALDDLSDVGCDYYYKFTNKATGMEIARAKTNMVFFNYETRKMVPVPDAFRQIYSKSQETIVS